MNRSLAIVLSLVLCQIGPLCTAMSGAESEPGKSLAETFSGLKLGFHFVFESLQKFSQR